MIRKERKNKILDILYNFLKSKIFLIEKISREIPQWDTTLLKNDPIFFTDV